MALTSDTEIADAAREWLPRKKAAALLAAIGCPISHRTLEKWAASNNAGKGPPFTRVRWNIVRYHRDDLIEWARVEAKRIV